MHTKNEKLETFSKILDIMEQMRIKCPWNRAQTFQSLRPMTLEEVYELSDAVLKENNQDLKKELGDVLLHIVFYSRIAEENGLFDIADVIDTLCEKMIYRHPHVFSSAEVIDEKEVALNWERLKTKEKGGNRTVLSGVPESMPSIMKAMSMQKKARDAGFEWDKSFTLDNLRTKEDFGNLLFSLINAAQSQGIDPDVALNEACGRFKEEITQLENKSCKGSREE